MSYRLISVFVVLAAVGVVASRSEAQVEVGPGEVLAQEDLIAGEFNGQVFKLSEDTVFHIQDGGLLTGLPEINFEPFRLEGSKIILESGSSFRSVRDGEGTFLSHAQLDVLQGSVIEGDRVIQMTGGSQVNLLGGSIQTALRLYGTNMQMDSGTIAGLVIHNNSLFIMNSGEIAGALNFAGVNPVGIINDGHIGGSVRMSGTSLVQLRGSGFGGESEISNDAELLWYGGAIGHEFNVLDNARLRVFGGEYRLNNQPISELDRDLQLEDILEGVLSDGLPFVFTPQHNDIIPVSGIELNVVSVPPADTQPIVLENQVGPSGFRGAESVQVNVGGIIPGNAVAIDTSIILSGGEIEPGFECVRSEIEVFEGEIGWEVALLDHSRLLLHDGNVSSWMRVASHSQFDMHGGELLWSLRISGGGTVNQYAGSIGTNLNILNGGVLNVRGGSRGTGMVAHEDSEYNLFVQSATIDGVPIELVPDVPRVIVQRGGAVLEGILASGESFRHELHDGFSFSDIFLPGSVVTLIRTRSCEADLNGDGDINFFDVSAFLVAYQNQDPAADFNSDGMFNFFDVSAFLTAYNAGCS